MYVSVDDPAEAWPWYVLFCPHSPQGEDLCAKVGSHHYIVQK